MANPTDKPTDAQLGEDVEDFHREAYEFFKAEAPEEWTLKLMEEQGCRNPYSQTLFEKIARRGYLGLTIPREYGGQGRPHIYMRILLEVMPYCRVPESIYSTVVNTAVYLANMLINSGNDNLKKRWLPLIARGEMRNCIGLTEPNAGTDAASVETRAVRKGNNFVLNGTKLFNNAHHADWMTTVTKTNTLVPKHKGISLFLVDLRSPGVTISPTLITGGGEKRSEVKLEDVIVPEENLIGKENEGWGLLLGPWLSIERAHAAAMNYAITKRGFEDVLEYVKERGLSKVPWVRYQMADAYTRLESLRIMTDHLWSLVGKQHDISKEVSIAKVYSSEFVGWFTNLALDILGPCGALEQDSPYKARLFGGGMPAALYADNQKTQVGAGVNEIQRDQIAIRFLGLPRFKG